MDLTLLLIIGGALAIILLIVGLVISIRGQKSEVDERLGRYAGTEKPKPSEEEKKAQSQ